AVRSVAFSPDGKWVASAGADPEIKIWDAATGKDVKALKGHTEFLTGIAFSPDGKWLVAGGGDRRVRASDRAAGTPKHDLPGHNLQINGVAFGGDSKTVASVSGDRMVRLWDAVGGTARLSAMHFQGNAFCVAFHPAGQGVAVGGAEPNAAKLLSLADGAERQVYEGHTKPVTCLAFSKDGKTLATGSSDHTIKL